MLHSRYTLHTAAAMLFLACAFSVPVRADIISDPVGDFLPSYLGPPNGDLDVVTAQVSYDGKSFKFESLSDGNIGLTPGGFFVWGVDRGTGLARFGPLASNVLFDAVVVLTPGGSSLVRDLNTSVSTPLDASNVSFSGNRLVATVDASLLPSTGFQPQAFTVNLWPRLPGDTSMISDFAPNNSNASLTITPEPTTFAILAGALPLLAVIHRRKRALA